MTIPTTPTPIIESIFERKTKLDDYDNLDAYDKEVVRRVLGKLFHKIVSDEGMKRIEKAGSEHKLTLPSDGIRGFMDNMLMNYATQQPYAMAQWYLELRQHVLEMLYFQEGEDMEEDVEEQMDHDDYKLWEDEPEAEVEAEAEESVSE